MQDDVIEIMYVWRLDARKRVLWMQSIRMAQVIKYSMVRLQYAQIKASCRVMPDNTTPPKSRVAVHVHHPHPVPRPSASAPDHTLPSF